MGLFYPSTSSLDLQAYCDVDWASCTFFLVHLLSRGSWKRKLQILDLLLKPSIGVCLQLLSSLNGLFILFGIFVFLLLVLFLSDCHAPLHIVANPVFHENIKHLHIDFHFISDQHKVGLVHPVFVSSSSEIADLFTKFTSLFSKLPLITLPCPT